MKMRNILKRITALLAAAALIIPAFPVCAEEMQSKEGAAQTAEKQSIWEITYNPGAYVWIMSEVFEGVLGQSETPPATVSVEVQGLGLSFEGKYYSDGDYLAQIPYDEDVKKGTYDCIVCFEREDGSSGQVDPGVLRLKVPEDMKGIHLINTVAETDGSEDAVFYMENGTGPNRVVAVDSVSFMARDNSDVPESEWYYEYWGFHRSKQDIEFDPDKGTVTIPKEWIGSTYEQFGMSFIPYVYYWDTITFTLESGNNIYIKSPYSVSYEGTPIDEFQNPGDEAWYFIYRESEQNVMLGDINLDGEVNSGDLAYMLQVTNKRIDESELSETQLKAGDVSGTDVGPDGVINSGDLAKLLQYINGRIESLG